MEAPRASAEIARRAGAAFAGLCLEAPLELRLERIARRRDDASDADTSIGKARRADPLAEKGWTAIDATRTQHGLAASARKTLADLASAQGSAIRAAGAIVAEVVYLGPSGKRLICQLLRSRASEGGDLAHKGHWR